MILGTFYIPKSRYEDAYLRRVWRLLEIAIRSGSTNRLLHGKPSELARVHDQ
jgi:hypothetical protein